MKKSTKTKPEGDHMNAMMQARVATFLIEIMLVRVDHSCAIIEGWGKNQGWRKTAAELLSDLYFQGDICVLPFRTLIARRLRTIRARAH